MFSPALVAKLYPSGEPPALITHVDAAGKDVTSVGDLGSFKQLLRLNLENNKLTEFGGLAESATLKQLLLAGNRITKVPKLDIPQLQVLNMADNQVSGTVKLRGAPKLRALILTNNAITGIRGLGKLPDLNTLVIKNNSITELSDMLRGCTALEKLSMAHNEVADLGDSLAGLPSLQELRLGHNELTRLPNELTANTWLKIVDLSGCPLKSPTDLQVLAKLPLLQQLNVKGAPLAAGATHKEELLEMLPLLEILDGKRVRQRIRGRLMRQQEADGQAAAPTASVKGNRKGSAGSQGAASTAQAADDTGGSAGQDPDAAEPGALPTAGGKRKAAASTLPGSLKKRRQPADGRQPAAELTAAEGQTSKADRQPAGPAAAAAAVKSQVQQQQQQVQQQQQKKQQQQQEAEVDSESDADQPAAHAAGDERSFLEEVLAPQAHAAPQQAAGGGGKAGPRAAPESGVVAVVELQPAQKGGKKGGKTRRGKKGGAAAAPAAAGAAAGAAAPDFGPTAAAAPLTGASVARLLQSELGIATTRDVGTGGAAGGLSAWDVPE